MVRRLGPGVYRAEQGEWRGPVREGPWWEARAAAQDDADDHAGRERRPRATGGTPSRPVRIADPLWSGVAQAAELEGTSASEIIRRALAVYPPVVEALRETA